MAAPDPGDLHSLYAEQDIKIKFRCNHALQNLNPSAAHLEHEHLAFIIIFEHQNREQFGCFENLHLLPLITCAADFQKWQPRPNFSLSAPLFGLPRAPEWPGPPPLLNGHLVPVFLEKSECSPASASRDRMFEYLGYHRIVSIAYYPRSSTKTLSAQQLWERLYESYHERFPAVPRLSRLPMPRAPGEWLNRLGIEHALLSIESVEEPKADEDAIPKNQGSRGKGRVKAVIKEERDHDWVMVSEPLTSELVKLPNGDNNVTPKQQGQCDNGRGEAVIKEEGEDDWVVVSRRSNDIAIGIR